ncbi:uncharacterized protein LOC122259513, partial [Penaeus japonicus]|uniref:uncharacterized protein LOC122259513 n=1 Tax=Penaeus japonicus TaxID=27405 RepID=UPI001C7170AD
LSLSLSLHLSLSLSLFFENHCSKQPVRLIFFKIGAHITMLVGWQIVLHAISSPAMAAAVAASGIAAAFVVGAVGLGIASVARTLANIRFRRRHHFRYGRSIREDSAALERTMALIRKEDVTGCGMRLVCELGALPAHRRDAHGDAILELVG